MSRLQPASGADDKILWLASSLCKTQRSADALALIVDACHLKPEQTEYHNSRGLVLQACQRHGEAFEAFDTELMLLPECAAMLKRLLQKLSRLGA